MSSLAHARRHLGHRDQRRIHRGHGRRGTRRRDRPRRPADPRPVRQDPGGRRRHRRLGVHARRRRSSRKVAEADPEVGRDLRAHGQLPGGAHALLRRVLRRRPSAAGIRQIVILASGLDSRAYRLRLARGHHRLRDRPAQGARVQGRDAGRARRHSRPRSAARCRSTCATTGRPRCATRASTPSAPTAWLAEGLLMYLPADAQDRLFEQITELSAPGSRVAAETVGVQAEDRRERMRERFAHDRRAVRHGGADRRRRADVRRPRPRRRRRSGSTAHGWTASGGGLAGRDAPAGPLGARRGGRRRRRSRRSSSASAR